MPDVTKDQVAETLEDIAMMLELKGENPFKIRAYRNAARAIETFTGNLKRTAEEDKFADIEGIGDAIAEKIRELVKSGSLAYHTTLKAEFPPGIFDMFDI
ncbi:MAG: histidinol-phosphatase, partial [Chthoniobacteraceae bacterium]